MEARREDQQEEQSNDAARLKRRRRLLYGLFSMAIVTVAVIAGIALFSSDGEEPATAKQKVEPPVIVERFRLTAAKGQKGRGLAEFVRRDNGSGLRVLAVELKPSHRDQTYQLLLAGRRDSKVLGNQRVGREKTFVGEAKLTGAELHRYSRIELRRVTEGPPPESELVLRGRIER